MGIPKELRAIILDIDRKRKEYELKAIFAEEERQKREQKKILKYKKEYSVV